MDKPNTHKDIGISSLQNGLITILAQLVSILRMEL